MGSYPNYMKRGELRNDLCTVTFLTDHAVVMPKYHAEIPVGGNRRGTGIIRKTCEGGYWGQESYARNDKSLCTGSVLKSGVW